MTLPRLIPALLLRDGGLWKTQRFAKPKYVGDPINAIRIFNEKEVDELVLFDIQASREGRGPNWELISECAGECFMPMGYGGGIDSVEDAERVVSLGIEKVVLNHAGWSDLGLVSGVSRAVGSSSTVVCLDVRRPAFRGVRRFDHVRKKATKDAPIDAARAAAEAGAGELIIQDVDREGVGGGVDLELIEAICDAVSVPVTVLGGVESLDHARAAWRAGVSGVAAGSWFVFRGPHRAVLISYPPYADILSAWNESQS